MKKSIAALLCIVLALSVTASLTACSGGKTATEPADTTATVDKATVDESSKMSYEIVTAREENYSYDDSVGNHFDITIAIPEVKMDSEGARSVNSKIKMNFDPVFDQLDECRAGGYSPMLSLFEYDHSEANGILSVWVNSIYDGGSQKVSVYNLDLNDGSELNSNKSIVEKLGLDKEQVKGYLEDAITGYFQENYSDMEKSSKDLYDQKLKESLSEDFISSAVYFVKDGHLCAKVTIAQLAGGYASEKMVELCGI